MKPKDAWAIAKGCRIGLAVLRPEPNYLESIPTKMYEYMALGLPVILSNFPLYRDVVSRHQCGLCVDPGDPEDLAAAILQLLGDPQKAREMGERGRQAVVRNYDWEHQLDHLVALYANCGVHGRETDVLGGVSSARKVEAQ
jgi:glycosyltransferase involved in cell wall biosynthesis